MTSMLHARLRSLLAAFLMAVPAYYFASARSWRPDGATNWGASRFFNAQMHAILNGRLDVDSNSLPGECFVRGTRCFGYFGLTPSLLRLPVAIVDSRSFTPVYLAAAMVLACAVIADLVGGAVDAAGLSERARWALWALLTAPLATCLLLVPRPWVYDEAIAWSVAFALLGVRSGVRWLASRRRSEAILGVVWWAAAASCRPTQMIPPVVLGALLLWWSTSSERRQRLLSAATLAAVPALLCLGVYVLKFGTPFPAHTLNEQVPESPAWAQIYAVNGARSEGAVFLPTDLYAYLRPDGIRFGGDALVRAPRLAAVPPLPAGGSYVEPVVSVTALLPAQLAMLVWVFAMRLRRRRSPTEHTAGVDLGTAATVGNAWVWLTVACSSAVLLTVSNVAITQRYVLDFLPALVCASCAAVPLLASRWQNAGRRWMIGALGACSVWSVVVALLLARSLALTPATLLP